MVRCVAASESYTVNNKMASDKQPLSSNNTAAAGSPRAGMMPQETLPARKTCSGYHVYKILSIIYAIIFVVSELYRYLKHFYNHEQILCSHIQTHIYLYSLGPRPTLAHVCLCTPLVHCTCIHTTCILHMYTHYMYTAHVYTLHVYCTYIHTTNGANYYRNYYTLKLLGLRLCEWIN